jgi:hypothetical protein
MSESITNLDEAVRELGALPMPVGQEPRTLDVVEHELTGVNLALHEEELDNTRLRLALLSAQRGRRRQRARAAQLEAAAVDARAALAAFCYDLEDPGTAALGALYLLQQATCGTPMQAGETVPKAYRASHDSIVFGLYTTAAAAREHCETLLRREWPHQNLDWIEDEEDGVAELVAWIGGEECSSDYVVTELEIAATYDPDADE